MYFLIISNLTIIYLLGTSRTYCTSILSDKKTKTKKEPNHPQLHQILEDDLQNVL